METSIDEPPSLFLLGEILTTDITYYAINAVILLLLLIFSALVSGSEVAFFSINAEEITQFEKRQSRVDKMIASLLAKPKELLATILILNNFINVAIITLSTFVMWRMVGSRSADGYAIFGLTLVVTFLIVFLGEIAPKVFANQKRLKFARVTAGILTIAFKIVKPMTWLLVSLTNIVDRRIEKRGYETSLEEINQALELTTQSGTSQEEKDILKGIVNFSSIAVTQIMKSRLDIEAVDIEVNFHELMDRINKSGFSRMPVFNESLDNIEGVLYVKDLLPYTEKDESFEWQKLLRQVYFVPESKKIDALLKDFQEKRVHIAIVVDEYGGTEGLITMEDIIEEIVGEINDEFDDEEKQYQKIDDLTIDFEGKTSINDVCKVLEISPNVFDPIRGESESVGGMILEVHSRLPNTGESINFDNYLFTVMSVDNRRIKKVRIKVNA